MIKIENVETCNWRAAIRGMRNPLESWDRSDTDVGCDGKKCYECGFKPDWCGCTPKLIIGPNDLKLMKSLVNAGTDHSKFMRMITVSFDVVAPLYWWKEYDTYKIAVVRNSCSTMHKIEARPLELKDFAKDGMEPIDIQLLNEVIFHINNLIKEYKEATGEHKLQVHRRIVKLLPDSYLQRATITTNYQVLRNIRNSDRKTHKLLEWRDDFMKFIDSLPYAKELLIEDDAYKYEKAKSFIERFDKEHGPLYKFLERADIIKPVDEEYKKIIESGDKRALAHFKMKHGYTMTKEEQDILNEDRVENPPRLCDDFDGDFNTEAESKAFQKALQGIKTYAKKKDECEGCTCYQFFATPPVMCSHLTKECNIMDGRYDFTCNKKQTGISIPFRNVCSGLEILPGAFNGEEF